jgi:AbrB family looped-hinge helix DNA binding protein
VGLGQVPGECKLAQDILTVRMLTSKISSKGQTVLPREVREQLGLKQGSSVAYRIEGDCVTLRKLPDYDVEWHRAIAAVCTEWFTPEDEEEYRDLRPR